MKSARNNRNDRMLELKHAGDTTTAHTKTPDLSLLSEVSVGTGDSKTARRRETVGRDDSCKMCLYE